MKSKKRSKKQFNKKFNNKLIIQINNNSSMNILDKFNFVKINRNKN